LFLQQDPEYPVVIPYKFSDFRSPTDAFILNAVRRNFLIRDLFGFQSPLKQEYFFFGRNELVQNVIDLHKAGQNSSLFGLRKSGKTSTIYAIQRRAHTQACKIISIDCQDPAVHAKTYGRLLEYILIAVRRELNLKLLDLKLGSKPDEIAENFRRHMSDALNAGGTDILLIFDEIENISPKTAASDHWTHGQDSLLFWQTLRSFFQSDNKRKLTFCFVGTNPHLVELTTLSEIANPVYLFAPKTFIPMLSRSDTEELVSRLGYFMGLDFSSRVVDHIHKRFGGHPFFTRQLCSWIHKKEPHNRPREVSIIACEAAERDATPDMQGYLSEILNTLRKFYPEEYEMLVMLANGDGAGFKELADYSPFFISHLIGYGLVVRRGDDYEFSFDAIAEAVNQGLQKQSAIGKRENSRSWAEVSEKRNQLEQDMRTSLFYWSNSLSDDGWFDALRLCLTQKRLSEVGALDRRTAFARTGSPLYLIEVLKFVQLAGKSVVGDADVSRVSAAIQLVSSQRIDAHAKAISGEELGRLIEALDFLQTIFGPPI
jgi:hypothetical protein